MDNLINSIGKRLQEMRKKEGITLKELAEKLNVTASLLSQVEHGKASPSLNTLKSAADYFAVPIASLFDGIGVESVDPVKKAGMHKKIVSKGGC